METLEKKAKNNQKFGILNLLDLVFVPTSGFRALDNMPRTRRQIPNIADYTTIALFETFRLSIYTLGAIQLYDSIQ